MLDFLTSSSALQIIAIIAAVNAILSAVGALLDVVHQSSASNVIKTIVSGTKKILDFLQGNVAH